MWRYQFLPGIQILTGECPRPLLWRNLRVLCSQSFCQSQVNDSTNGESHPYLFGTCAPHIGLSTSGRGSRAAELIENRRCFAKNNNVPFFVLNFWGRFSFCEVTNRKNFIWSKKKHHMFIPQT